MQRLLFDEGLPGGARVPEALSALGLPADAVGVGDAPPRASTDEINCGWCASNNAVLVTHDRGNEDREILQMLNRYEIGAIIVLKGLLQRPPHHLARALLCAESEADNIANGRKRLRHHLRPSGTLKPVGR